MSPGVPTQLTLDLWKRDRDLNALAQHCELVGLLASDVAILLAMARDDQTRDRTSFASHTLREWGRLTNRDHKTAGKALQRLADCGVALLETPENPRSQEPYSILVDWVAVFALEPSGRDPATVRQRLEARHSEAGDTLGTPLGTPGDTCTTCSSSKQTKSLCSNRVPVLAQHVASAAAGEDVGTPPLVDRLPGKPWAKRGGIDEATFVASVRTRDRATLTRLYFAGVEAGFWDDCEVYHQTFLACCWAAFRCAKSSAVGLLKGYVRWNLRDRSSDNDTDRKKYRLANEDDHWATETRRQWNTPREYLEATRSPRAAFVTAGEV